MAFAGRSKALLYIRIFEYSQSPWLHRCSCGYLSTTTSLLKHGSSSTSGQDNIVSNYRQILTGWKSRLYSTTMTETEDSNNSKFDKDDETGLDLNTIKVTTGVTPHNVRGYCFNATYVDYTVRSEGVTLSESDPPPVVLGIHGTPGCHQDMLPVLTPLAERGYRVIAPNIPGFGTNGCTEEDDNNYKPSVTERGEFIHNFLLSLGVKQVELVIGHSSGCYSALYIAATYPEQVRRMMFVNPGYGHRPLQAPYLPRWFIKASLNLYETNKVGRWLETVIGNFFLKNYPMPFSDITQMFLASKVLVLIDSTEVLKIKKMVGLVTQRRLPLTYVFCKGDPLMPTVRMKEYSALFGISKNIDVYDKIVQLTQSGCEEAGLYRKGVMFTRRTHFPPAHADLCSIIVQETLNILHVKAAL